MTDIMMMEKIINNVWNAIILVWHVQSKKKYLKLKFFSAETCVTCDVMNDKREIKNGECKCPDNYYDKWNSKICLKCNYTC